MDGRKKGCKQEVDLESPTEAGGWLVEVWLDCIGLDSTNHFFFYNLYLR